MQRSIFIFVAMTMIGCGVGMNSAVELDPFDTGVPIVVKQPGPVATQGDTGYTPPVDTGVDTGTDTGTKEDSNKPDALCGDAICPAGKTCKDGHCVCDGDDSPDKSCKDGKVLLCHYPPGDPDNRHEICVAKEACDAHHKHGDSDEKCP